MESLINFLHSQPTGTEISNSKLRGILKKRLRISAFKLKEYQSRKNKDPKTEVILMSCIEEYNELLAKTYQYDIMQETLRDINKGVIKELG